MSREVFAHALIRSETRRSGWIPVALPPGFELLAATEVTTAAEAGEEHRRLAGCRHAVTEILEERRVARGGEPATVRRARFNHPNRASKAFILDP